METPCIGICRLDAAGACEGCGRSRDEIARWSAMSHGERRAIMQRLAHRRPTLEQPAADAVEDRGLRPAAPKPAPPKT